MAVSRKPRKTAAAPVPAADDPAAQFIGKGGSPAEATDTTPVDDDPLFQIQLRLPRSIVDRIDETRKRSTLRKPRTTWIAEAIVDKLERETVSE